MGKENRAEEGKHFPFENVIGLLRNLKGKGVSSLLVAEESDIFKHAPGRCVMTFPDQLGFTGIPTVIQGLTVP